MISRGGKVENNYLNDELFVRNDNTVFQKQTTSESFVISCFMKTKQSVLNEFKSRDRKNKTMFLFKKEKNLAITIKLSLSCQTTQTLVKSFSCVSRSHLHNPPHPPFSQFSHPASHDRGTLCHDLLELRGLLGALLRVQRDLLRELARVRRGNARTRSWHRAQQQVTAGSRILEGLQINNCDSQMNEQQMTLRTAQDRNKTITTSNLFLVCLA